MKKLYACLIVLACIAPLSAQQGELYWHNNYEDALAEAKQTGKPIFLEYRCSP